MSVEPDYEYTTLLVDGVLENSSIIEGLSEDTAKFFVEWSVAQAKRIGPIATDEESFDGVKRAFNRSLRVMNAVCMRRAEGVEALKPLVDRLNEFGTLLAFESIDDAAIEVLIAQSDAGDMAFIQQFTSMLEPESDREAVTEVAAVEGANIPSENPLASYSSTPKAEQAENTESVVDAETETAPNSETE